jgi:hypothetical protein
MNIADMALVDLIGAIVGFFLTLLVLSYLFLGDYALFRLAIGLFVGVAAGYVGGVVVYSVLLPRLITPLRGDNRAEQLLVVLPLLMGALLLTKISPRLSRLGTLPMAYLVGVGAATAIGGAVTGTLFPQIAATFGLLDRQAAAASGTNLWVYLLNGTVVLVGTICTLAYFHFAARARPNEPSARPLLIAFMAQIGQVFIAITFGVLFAGVYAAALAAFVERLYSLADFINQVLLPMFQSSL